MVHMHRLRGKVILQNVDRYAFLIVSPMLVLLELIILKFYYHNPKILGQPGILYIVIIAFELLFNIHFIASACINCLTRQPTTQLMSPDSACPTLFQPFARQPQCSPAFSRFFTSSSC